MSDIPINKRKSPDHGLMNCKLCNTECQKTSAMQKYCRPCSEIKDLERKSKWAKENPKTIAPEKLKERYEKFQSESLQRGNEANKNHVRSITWMGGDPVDLDRIMRISVPFSWSFSKNAIYSMNASSGHVFLRKKARGVRDHLTRVIMESMKGQEPFKKNKIWLDILVQKPNNKGDAVNLVDSICDAVKVAIGVDDRYFSIRRLDWEIVKSEPRLFVGIGQEHNREVFQCSYCGQTKEIEFKSTKRRCCIECSGIKPKKAKASNA